MEVLLCLVATSAKVYLQVIEEMDYPCISNRGGSTSGKMSRSGVELIPDAVHALRILPAPWGACDNESDGHLMAALLHAEMRYNAAMATTRSHVLMTPAMRPEIYPTNSYSSNCNNALALSRRIPALVINLRRRPDRWRNIRKMCQAARISAIRVDAVDGKHIMTGQGGSSNSDAIESIGDLDLDTLTERTALNARIDHDVCHTWDSALNHMFDPMCFASRDVPCTHSERACSMSHVRAWKRVARIRQVLYGVALPYDTNTSGASSNSKKHIEKNSKILWEEDEIAQREQEQEHERTGLSLQAATEAIYRITTASDGCEPYIGSEPINKNTPWNYPQHSNGNMTADTDGPDSDWYLILEDDAALTPDLQQDPSQFPKIISECLKSLPNDWDLLYLGHAAHRKGKGPDVVGTLCRPLFHARYMWQLHGYILRGKAVGKIIAQLPVKGPVDNFIASLTYDNTLIAYGLRKNILIQPGTYIERQADSDIRHSGRDVIVSSGDKVTTMKRVKESQNRNKNKESSTSWRGAGIKKNVRFKKTH